MQATKRLWIETLLHLVFWAGVLYVLTSLNSSHIHIYHKGPLFFRDTYEDKPVAPYVYVILAFLTLLFYGNIFWVFRKLIRYKKGIVRLAIGAGWFIMIFSANYFVVGPLFDQANPIPEPPPGFRHPIAHPDNTRRDSLFGSIVRDNVRSPVSSDATREADALLPGSSPRVGAISFMTTDWQHIQSIILLAFLVIQGIAIAYFFLNEWAKSALIQSRLQANQLSTEIKFLKSQINPHFLFNTLNNLFSMAQGKGNDELADGISKLSGMMRYMLYDSNEESVPLIKEITYLEECITLNKLRYADGEITVTFDHARPTADITIAPMLFIPFVENAFKHGAAIGQRAVIQIALDISGQQLTFTCVNTDYSSIKKMDMEISGIGLENVRRRLELAYPTKHQLLINKGNGKFTVKLEIDCS
ncbi:MAG: sensor histidine kinase [Bacteroidetes bacterium]|nr:sensor histidine kinase [Bacteroidota bacterium]